MLDRRTRWLRLAMHACIVMLVARAVLIAQPAHADEDDASYAWVRLTYYTLSGLTFSGGHPYYGSTACSWNFPIGTSFTFDDGEQVVCNDRGMLGSSGWLDVWRQPALVARYGRYALVQVAYP